MNWAHLHFCYYLSTFTSTHVTYTRLSPSPLCPQYISFLFWLSSSFTHFGSRVKVTVDQGCWGVKGKAGFWFCFFYGLWRNTSKPNGSRLKQKAMKAGNDGAASRGHVAACWSWRAWLQWPLRSCWGRCGLGQADLPGARRGKRRTRDGRSEVSSSPGGGRPGGGGASVCPAQRIYCPSEDPARPFCSLNVLWLRGPNNNKACSPHPPTPSPPTTWRLLLSPGQLR